MPFEFHLPDIGEGLVEGEIVKWLVKEGDTVKEDQPLVEVMTDKATVEITSPRAGKIQKLLANEGDTVKVESLIVVIDTGDGAATSPHGHKPVPPKSAPGAATPLAPLTASTSTANETPWTRALAAPAVRRSAKEQGIDINTLKGSGPGGRILREDLQPTPRPTASIPPASGASRAFMNVKEGGPVEELPLRGLRKRIAEQMVRAKQHAPHFTYVEEIDMSAIVKQRQSLKPIMQQRGVALTFLPFVFKAILPALRQYPLLNSTLDEARNIIRLKKYYNFGMAVNTDDGLTVAVVKNVDRLPLWELAGEIGRLSEAARNKKIAVEDLQDSTITISQVGNIGGFLSTPIINYPEVTIFGVNQIRERAVVRDGQIVIRHIMYLSISCDHRVVDGGTAALAMNEIKRYLETPELLILE